MCLHHLNKENNVCVCMYVGMFLMIVIAFGAATKSIERVQKHSSKVSGYA